MTKKIKYLFIFCLHFLFCIQPAAAQQNMESLLSALKAHPQQDTTRLALLFEIIDNSNDDNFWPKINDEAYLLSEKLLKSEDTEITKRAKKGLADATVNRAFMYKLQGNVGLALECNIKGLQLQKEIGNKSGTAYCLNNLGNLYNQQGDIPKALEHYEQSMKLQEELGDKLGIAHLLNNTGAIYNSIGDYNNALNNYVKCYKLMEEVGNKKGIGNAFNNIGTIYHSKRDTAHALEYYKKSLKIRQEINDKKGIGGSLTNIGSLLKNQNKYKEALIYYTKGLEIKRVDGDKQGVSVSYNGISSLFFRQKMFRESKAYADSSLKISRELGYPDNIQKAEEALYMIDSATGNSASAFEHFKQFIFYRDSISNEASRNAALKNQLNYEFGKKEAVMKEQQEKERIVAAEKARFQQIVIIIVIIGLILVLLFALFVARTLKQTRIQKLLIEEKQREILDSIHYAKRIQSSLMPSEKHIDKNLRRLRKQ